MSTPKRFLMLIGAPKSASTSLASWLSDQPQFSGFADKEPKHFVEGSWKHYRTGEEVRTDFPTEAAYLANFTLETGEEWAVDASVDYLWRDGCADRIKAFAERYETKLVCILRDPIDRAFSEYAHTRRHEAETLSFQASLEAEAARRADNWDPLFFHARRSCYREDVHRYKALFADRLLILSYEDVRDPDAVVRRICDFVGVPFAPMVRKDAVVPAPRRGYGALTPLLRNPLTRLIARTLLGDTARARVAQKLSRALDTDIVLSEADKRAAYAHLADEIEACIADPLIPTDGWRTAQAMRAEAVDT